jgi:hypothetical protein
MGEVGVAASAFAARQVEDRLDSQEIGAQTALVDQTR